VTNQLAIKREIGIKLLINTPETAAIDPIKMAATAKGATSTIQIAQCLGPGIRSDISIISSPMLTVQQAPLMPIQKLRKIPEATTQMIAVPKIVPVLVANMTSPEPMLSAAHTKERPTNITIACLLVEKRRFFSSLILR